MYNKEDKILIIGAGGQIGIELTQELSLLYGSSNVIAADLKPIPALVNNPFEKLDILDKDALLNIANFSCVAVKVCLSHHFLYIIYIKAAIDYFSCARSDMCS